MLDARFYNRTRHRKREETSCLKCDFANKLNDLGLQRNPTLFIVIVGLLNRKTFRNLGSHSSFYSEASLLELQQM